MFNNPMQMMQLMGQLQQSNNPQMLIQNMFGNNPLMQRAMMMGQGKNPAELQQIVRNLARQRGISPEQFNNMMANFGLRI